MTALTIKRLEAIREALAHSLAGPYGGDRKAAEAALEWANERIEKKCKEQGRSNGDEAA
jgi:hypothetical protein